MLLYIIDFNVQILQQAKFERAALTAANPASSHTLIPANSSLTHQTNLIGPRDVCPVYQTTLIGPPRSLPAPGSAPDCSQQLSDKLGAHCI